MNQNLNLNPLLYFANTPQAINTRKNKASKPSSMKIINFTKHDDGSFIVSIRGNRGIIYQVFFSEQSITCDCPDYQKHTVKPICKHMFKLICLSENNDIFNNSMLLSDLMNPLYLGRILENIMRIIDVKKIERYGSSQNQISIERDDCCSICYGDFDNDITKCSKCNHVFHQNCIHLSWNSAAYNSHGKCPMCRTLNSFPQIGGSNNHDPWEIYNFPVSEPAQQELIVNPDDNPIIPEPDLQEALVQNELVLPFVDIPEPSSDNDENQNSESSLSLSSYENDYTIIENRMIILNISIFIVKTINILYNIIPILDPSSDPSSDQNLNSNLE